MISTLTIESPAALQGISPSSPQSSVSSIVPHPLSGVALLDMLAILAFVLDTHCNVVTWNHACERLTGIRADELRGSAGHWRGFYDTPRPTLADMIMQKRSSELATLEPTAAPRQAGGHLSLESWYDMPRRATLRYLACDASPIVNEYGQLVAVVQTLRDITDQKNAQLALEQLATRDGLTGLANRRCFDDTLKSEWARAMRQHQPLSLLMVDVDNFKAYNDANGHIGGDDCLKRVATAVASEMRASDLVARYGGEEFAVILPNQSLKGAAIVAERVRERVERLRLPNGQVAGQHVTVSIGAATAFAAPGTQPQQLLAIADAALYRAKHMGRNRISPPLTESA